MFQFLNVYLFLERESTHKQVGEGQRERETEAQPVFGGFVLTRTDDFRVLHRSYQNAYLFMVV